VHPYGYKQHFDGKYLPGRFLSSNQEITRIQNYKISQRGYVLLVLLLFVAVLSISFLAAVERIDFQIKRDREEELIHRGVQYSRAVRRYFKKFGRYPTRLEELESTNNIRFLRRRYKDPITGKDFKPLHLTDVQLSFSSGPAPGTPVADLAAQQAGAPGALSGGTAGPAGPGPTAIAGNQNPQAADQTEAPQQDQAASAAPPPPQPLSQRAGPGGAPQVFGGGAIVGVASVSKDRTIREFNKKDHYNQWQFIYDPSSDRGGLLMTPNQPPLQGAVQNVQQQPNTTPGQNPAPGTPMQPVQQNPEQ